MTFIVPKVHKPNLVKEDCRKAYAYAERYTLIFAICNITLASVVSICSIVGTIFWFCAFVLEDLKRPRQPPSDYDGLNFFFNYVMFAGLIIILFFSLVAFMFACFLINGVCKKRPEHIKAYYVYGVVVAVLASSAITVWTTITAGNDLLLFSAIFIVLFLYSLTLSMIRVTYRSYEQRALYQYGDNLVSLTTEQPNKM